MTKTCNKCKKNHKVLTKEHLCANCSYEENGVWPAEFTFGKKEKKR